MSWWLSPSFSSREEAEEDEEDLSVLLDREWSDLFRDIIVPRTEEEVDDDEVEVEVDELLEREEDEVRMSGIVDIRWRSSLHSLL
jgi:hypothetical protein